MASAMIPAKQEELGCRVQFAGQELIYIVAFLHDDDAQHGFTKDVIPVAMMEHEHAEGADRDAEGRERGSHAH